MNPTTSKHGFMIYSFPPQSRIGDETNRRLGDAPISRVWLVGYPLMKWDHQWIYSVWSKDWIGLDWIEKRIYLEDAGFSVS